MLLTTDMKPGFDQHAINHSAVAVGQEMVPHRHLPHAETDTLFMGGLKHAAGEAAGLAAFALRKNYRVIFASHAAEDARAGPTGYHAFVNDGIAESFTLSGGRLWKRDDRSASLLLFTDIGAMLKLSANGRLIVQAMRGPYVKRGYDLAHEAVLARAAIRPGKVPVVSFVGTALVVLDMGAMANTFAVAA